MESSYILYLYWLCIIPCCDILTEFHMAFDVCIYIYRRRRLPFQYSCSRCFCTMCYCLSLLIYLWCFFKQLDVVSWWGLTVWYFMSISSINILLYIIRNFVCTSLQWGSFQVIFVKLMKLIKELFFTLKLIPNV